MFILSRFFTYFCLSRLWSKFPFPKSPTADFNDPVHVIYIFFVSLLLVNDKWRIFILTWKCQVCTLRDIFFAAFNEVVFLFERNTHLWCECCAGDNWYLISDGSCISCSSLKKMSQIAFEKLLASLAQRQDVTFLLHNENHLLSYNVS